MADQPLRQRYQVVEVRTQFPNWTEAKDRIYQHIILRPIHQEKPIGGFALNPDVRNNDLHLHCWQDQRTFTVGQEVYLTVELKEG